MIKMNKKEMAQYAKAIHYPDCWDTAAYPTLMDAIWELLPVESMCTICGQMHTCDNIEHSKKENGWFIPTEKTKLDRWQRLEIECVQFIHDNKLRRNITHIMYDEPTTSTQHPTKKIIGQTIIKIYNPLEEDKDIYICKGIAYCSEKDQYNKQHARTIATGRAVKKLKEWIKKTDK
jgi:hypothetical protein